MWFTRPADPHRAALTEALGVLREFREEGYTYQSQSRGPLLVEAVKMGWVWRMRRILAGYGSMFSSGGLLGALGRYNRYV